MQPAGRAARQDDRRIERVADPVFEVRRAVDVDQRRTTAVEIARQFGGIGFDDADPLAKGARQGSGDDERAARERSRQKKLGN